MDYSRFALLVLITIFVFGATRSVSAAASAATLTKYRDWHNICLEGNVPKIDRQIEKFEQQLVTDPKDDLAKAFLGSACALRAKHGRWGPTKLKFLRRGRKLIEEAVASSPSDGRVRMVRAIAYYRIPKRFGVRNIALQDFDTLLPLAQAGGNLRKGERQAILYYGALAYREDKRSGAEKLLELCHQIDPNSNFGRLTKPSS